MAKRGCSDVPAANDTSQPKKSKAAAAATTSPTASHSLPDDLVAEVLLRLPSRSLARLRCACRAWNDLISSDGFQERHLQLQVEKPRRPSKLVLAPLAKRHTTPVGVLFMYEALCRDCPRIVGARPCRGLVLFGRPCAMAYSVCNPSTGGVLHLPPRTHRHTLVTSAGIGFHAPTKEYKVVQIVLVDFPRSYRMECRVLTVGDPVGWRVPPGEPCPLIRGIQEDIEPVFADGRLHWMLSPKFLYQPPQALGILSFSLGDESFATVPAPPFARADIVEFGGTDPYIDHIRPERSTEHGKEFYTPAGTALAELDGRLCMMRDLRLRGLDTVFEIWKLRDYESGSWSLDYSINIARGGVAGPLIRPWLVIPLSYLGSGSDSSVETRKVLLATTAHEAHVYDPATKTVRMVASMEDDEKSSCDVPEFIEDRLRLVLYQESLVWIAGMEHKDDTIGYSVLLAEDV